MLKAEIRETVLVRFQKVGITKEVHELLRIEKKKQKKSMMQIIDDLIKEKYEHIQKKG